MTTDQQSKDVPSDAPPLVKALARLNDALDMLERKVDSAIESQSGSASSGEEVQRLAADRAKLAAQIDTERARADRLAEVNGEVSRRLVGAMETVKKVLDKRE